jgi:hypothetical protein
MEGWMGGDGRGAGGGAMQRTTFTCGLVSNEVMLDCVFRRNLFSIDRMCSLESWYSMKTLDSDFGRFWYVCINMYVCTSM